MNFLNRAFLSVKARKGKSLLQLLVVSVIFTLDLAGVSIQSADDKSADLARKQLGGRRFQMLLSSFQKVVLQLVNE